MEIWKKTEYSEFYSVSNLGRVRNDRSGKVLKGCPNNKKYLLVDLKSPGFRKYVAIHSLVAKAFLGDRPEKHYQINHKNGIKTDNSAGNLEYVTPSENVRHAYRTGLIYRPILKPRISTKKRCILDKDKVLEIRKALEEGKRPSHLARIYRVSCPTISDIRYRRSWNNV